MEPPAVRIPVVVADDPVESLGVTTCLAASGFEVVAAIVDVRRLTATVESTQPGLVVIELGSQDRAHADALAAVADIVGRLGTRVLALSSDLRPTTVRAMLDGGCLGIVPRAITVHALVAAAGVVAGGERYIHQRALSALVQQPAAAGEPPVATVLSRRELGVLTLVAEGQTNAAIASRLAISSATVKTHVEKVLRKLHANDRAHAVSTAMRAGIIS